MYDCNISTVFACITFISVIDAKVVFLNRQCDKLKKVKPSYCNVSLPYSVLCSVKWHSETLCSVWKPPLKCWSWFIVLVLTSLCLYTQINIYFSALMLNFIKSIKRGHLGIKVVTPVYQDYSLTPPYLNQWLWCFAINISSVIPLWLEYSNTELQVGFNTDWSTEMAYATGRPSALVPWIILLI